MTTQGNVVASISTAELLSFLNRANTLVGTSYILNIKDKLYACVPNAWLFIGRTYTMFIQGDDISFEDIRDCGIYPISKRQYITLGLQGKLCTEEVR